MDFLLSMGYILYILCLKGIYVATAIIMVLGLYSLALKLMTKLKGEENVRT